MLAVDAMPFVWALIIILSIIQEAITSALIAIWLVPASMLSLVLAICGIDIWICTLVFFASAAVMLILSRTLFRGNLAETGHPIGKEGIVICEIGDRKTGIVRTAGREWQAEAKGKGIIPCGSIVKIKGVIGDTLICKIK